MICYKNFFLGNGLKFFGQNPIFIAILTLSVVIIYFYNLLSFHRKFNGENYVNPSFA